jgi:hypothetical protein
MTITRCVGDSGFPSRTETQEHERQHYNPSSDLVMYEFRFGSGQGRTDFREGVQRECDPKSRLTRVVEVTISE